MEEQKKAQAKQCHSTDGGVQKVMPTKQEKKAWNKAYYKANRDTIRAHNKAYYYANRDAIRTQTKHSYGSFHVKST